MTPRARRGQPPESAPPRARVPMSDLELEAFYREIFLPLVRRATWKHRLSKDDAADIVQDAFLLALTKLDSSGNPKAWLLQVVDHLALNFHRKAVRRAQLTSRWTLPSNHQTPREVAEVEIIEPENQ
jgi:DNA-directed RNA polymerase specialized sigma24 family protein